MQFEVRHKPSEEGWRECRSRCDERHVQRDAIPTSIQFSVCVTLKDIQSFRHATALLPVEELGKHFRENNSPFFLHLCMRPAFDNHCRFHSKGFWIFLIHSHDCVVCSVLLCYFLCPRTVWLGFLDISRLHLMQLTEHWTHQAYRI